MRDWIKKLIGKDERPYEEPPGIGIAWLWKLSDDHPFQEAALKHDAFYDQMLAGNSPFQSSKIPDLIFFQDCIRAARGSKYYIAQAYLFYGFVKIWGKLRWRNPSG
jgi:hypothetical protein